jgi:hypothetical protein
VSHAAPAPRSFPTDRIGEYAAAAFRRVSWGAVFAGMFIAIVTQVLLSLLGFGIGLGTVNIGQETAESAKGLGLGLAIWWVVSALIALFLGGWVAGRLAGIPRRGDGMLHGLVAWAVTTFLSLYLVTTAAGALVGGALNVVGQGIQAAGQGASAAAVSDQGQQVQQQGGTAEALKQTARDLITKPQTTAAEIQASIDAAITTGPDGRVQIDRQAASSMLVERAGMSQQQADTTVAQWERTIQQGQAHVPQLRQEARETAQDVTSTVSAAAIWSFVALLLGAVAAAIGGGMGAPRTVAAMAPVAPANT